MLAPKDDKHYFDVLCIESVEIIDHTWGDCSVNKGIWYKAIPDKHVNSYYLIKFRGGLCPHLKEHFKSVSEIREDKLNDLKI
jgi:hypothetical protein